MSSAKVALAKRVATDPSFFAHTIARYQAAHGVDDARLMALLGVDSLNSLRLCFAAASIVHLIEIAEHCEVANLEALGVVWAGGQ